MRRLIDARGKMEVIEARLPLHHRRDEQGVRAPVNVPQTPLSLDGACYLKEAFEETLGYAKHRCVTAQRHFTGDTKDHTWTELEGTRAAAQVDRAGVHCTVMRAPSSRLPLPWTPTPQLAGPRGVVEGLHTSARDRIDRESHDDASMIQPAAWNWLLGAGTRAMAPASAT
jgi:hypothetical protein